MTTPRPGFQFSVRTLLIVVTFAAMLMGMVHAYVRLYESEDELVDLRRQGGYLGPVEVDKTNIIAVPSSEDTTWKWRIYMPPGTKYNLWSRGGKIPATGFPKVDGGGPKEWSPDTPKHGVVVQAKIVRGNDGQFDLDLTWGTGRIRTALGSEYNEQHWFGGNSRTEMEGGGGTKTFDPNEPIVLLRYRVGEPGQVVAAQETATGVIVWLEPCP